MDIFLRILQEFIILFLKENTSEAPEAFLHLKIEVLYDVLFVAKYFFREFARTTACFSFGRFTCTLFGRLKCVIFGRLKYVILGEITILQFSGD